MKTLQYAEAWDLLFMCQDCGDNPVSDPTECCGDCESKIIDMLDRQEVCLSMEIDE